MSNNVEIAKAKEKQEADKAKQDEERAALLREIEADEKADRVIEAKRAEDRRIERYKLKKRFEKETNDREGRGFVIIECVPGFVVMVRRELVLYKALINSEKTDEEIDAFLQRCCAYPDLETLQKWMDAYHIEGALMTRTVQLFLGLITEDRTKK